MTFKFADFKPKQEMQGPQILGRMSGSSEARASTRRRAKVTIDVLATAEDLSVTLYESLDDEDRGGIVLEIESAGEAGFQPTVVQTENGVQLHMAGDGEAKALLTALLILVSERTSKEPLGMIRLG